MIASTPMDNIAILEQFARSAPQLYKEFISQFKEKLKTKYLLNCEGTQFPIGKTSKTLNRICVLNAAKIHSLYNNPDNDDDEHVISIIISSCNLQETNQWKIRATNKFQRKLNICTISSKTKNDKRGNGSNIDNFISSLLTLEESKLPNILLMCCHSQRINNDLITLLTAQKRMHLFNRSFRFNIFIDEADKNIKLVAKSLAKIKKYDLEEYIKEVHFITATPSKQFWKTLLKIGINKLDNFDIEFGKDITPEIRKQQCENYQSILTQDYNAYDFHLELDAFNYIKQIIDHTEMIDKTTRQILFVPGENKIQSHLDIKNYFIEKGYWVFMHNGGYIENGKRLSGKGFYNPSGKFMDIEDFKYQNKLPDNYEMRDILSHWNRLYPTKSLAITGYATIVRGLTFNTSGFNFTHMIFSNCHTKNLADFVQLLGRACGNKRYCRTIKIIGPKDPFERAKIFVKQILDLKEQDIIEYTADMFKISEANARVKIHTFDNENETLEFVKSIFGSRCNPTKIIKNHKNYYQNFTDENGLYKNILRKDNMAMTNTHIYNNRGWGMKDSRYRIWPCYKDLKDKSTLQFVVCLNTENPLYITWINGMKKQ